MTKLMKRYEAETGKKAIIPLSDTGKNVYRPSFTEWLAAQLTWRYVDDSLLEGELYIGKYINNDVITFRFKEKMREHLKYAGIVKYLRIPKE